MRVFLAALPLLIYCLSGQAQQVVEGDFRTSEHPRVFVTAQEKQQIIQKVQSVEWAKELYDGLKKEVDPIVAIHQDNPGYVISRMQMHWETGKRYTRFFTEGNYIPRREGNAKYPTVRVTFGRAASNSVPLAPLDKIIPYGDGSLTKPAKEKLGIVKIDNRSMNDLSNMGLKVPFDTVPFNKTGLGTETANRAFIHLAWKSSILYYLTNEKAYAKLTADIIWTFVRGASQQEQVNPHMQGGSNGYLSFETLGDTRHFSTLPLAYDMIYDYLHEEYFDLKQFTEGLSGEMWAPAHTEGKKWALQRFEIMFKRLIENKLNRGGALHGNWNTNEHQSAMLYALALDDDSCYADGKGRAYYVNKLIYGPTTETHGAYVDVLRANISPVTGLWPEAPGGYGQGSTAQLVRFGYIYHRNGIDLLSKDPLLQKATGAMRQMLFPNGYVTNYGDATYARMNVEPLELMMAYYKEKEEESKVLEFAQLMNYVPNRNLNDEFYYSLFFYLPEIPQNVGAPELGRTSYSSVYSLIFGRNNAENPKDALAYTLMGYGARTGHRQPNGMNMELYGRGHVLAPDQGIGQDYWSHDTHEYKINVAAHNTVSPNGRGADNNMPQELEILNAEPTVIDGEEPKMEISQNHQYVDALNHFYTDEIKADQRRMLSIVRTSEQGGYFVDIFRSTVIEGENRYHDYIYHNMGVASEVSDAEGKSLALSTEPLDSLSGKGYSYFNTIGSLSTDQDTRVDFHLGVDDTHMRMFMLGGENRTFYHLNSLFNHRYYEPTLRDLPVPAVLVRQEGEAWKKPFIAVYEPYGNGAEAQITSVCTEKTGEQEGIAKLTVTRKDGTVKDRIIHSTDAQTKAEYSGIKFTGTYCVVSQTGKKLESVYLANCTRFDVKGLKVSSKDGKPFNASFEVVDGKLKYNADKELIIQSKYSL